jgi:N-acetylglutamate synthase-like GNAT family acetyltransferase
MTQIRPADERDADAASQLLAQLGYPAAPAAVAERIRRLSADPNATVLIAEADGVVVGLATFHLMRVLHETAPRGQLTALVVAEAARRQGVGLALVRHVEALAGRHGVVRLVVTTANHRTETHEFYARLGFEWTGRRYAKRLDGVDAETK